MIFRRQSFVVLTVALLATVTLGVAGCGLFGDGGGGLSRYGEFRRQYPEWAFADLESALNLRVIYVAPPDFPRREPHTKPGSICNAVADLQYALDSAADGDVIQLAPGRYSAVPRDGIDPLAGNLPDDQCIVDIPITVGFRVTSNVRIQGAGAGQTILQTNAGYGVLIENLGLEGRASLHGLSITGGIRDRDDRATSAGVVVRNANAGVFDCEIVGNNQYPDPEMPKHPGIIGICAREGSTVTAIGCRITGNTWDGIAAYRSHPEKLVPATLDVRSCTISSGNGAGIGITWDAQAIIQSCEIHDYWKGVGSFGTSRVLLRDSVVRDQLGWGVIASGESRMAVINTAIVNNGTTGVARWNPSANLLLVNNIIAGHGHAEREWVGKRVGLWLNPGELTESIHHNMFWDNRPVHAGSGGQPLDQEPLAPIEIVGVNDNFAAEPEWRDAEKKMYWLPEETAAHQSAAELWHTARVACDWIEGSTTPVNSNHAKNSVLAGFREKLSGRKDFQWLGPLVSPGTRLMEGKQPASPKSE